MNEQTNEHYYCMQGIKNISQLYLGNIKKTKLLTCCVYIKETSCTIDALQNSCRKKNINFIILLPYPLQKISYFFTIEALQYSCWKKNNNFIIFSSSQNFLFFTTEALQ